MCIRDSMHPVTCTLAPPLQTKLACTLDSGLLWLGTISRRLASIQLDTAPSRLAWCLIHLHLHLHSGYREEAVLVTLSSGSAVLVHTSGAAETMFRPEPLCLVQVHSTSTFTPICTSTSTCACAFTCTPGPRPAPPSTSSASSSSC